MNGLIYQCVMHWKPLMIGVLGCLTCTAPLSLAQDGPNNPAIDPKKAIDRGVAMPTPLDKFLALSLLVKTKDIDWNGTFNAVAVDIDPDKYTDKDAVIPELLGIRIADGIMAIQAKDAEMLGKAASDIEKLAAKIDVSDGDLARAKRVRTMANEGKWMDVFRELGFLQQDIMQKLEEKPNDPRSSLLMVTGWLQGSRYTSRLISQHYNDATSNIMREPLLVAALQAKVDRLPASVKATPAVAKIAEALPRLKQLVNVGIDKPIPKKDIEEIHAQATACIKAIIQ